MATSAEAQEQLTAWEGASLAASYGQSYSIQGRDVSRYSAQEIRDMIEYWRRALISAQAAESGRPAVMTAAWYR